MDIQSRILDPPPLASAIPKGCYLVSQDDEPHLRRFLLTRGLVRLIDVSEVPYDTAGHLGIVLANVHFLTGCPKMLLKNV